MKFKEIFEIMQGLKPAPADCWKSTLLLASWWIFLVVASLSFMGRGSKFVYIDF